MRWSVLTCVVAAAIISGGEVRCCKADMTSYESWGRMTLTVIGVYTEPSGGQNGSVPQDLFMVGEANVYRQMGAGDRQWLRIGCAECDGCYE
jgi:hypothetical protein